MTIEDVGFATAALATDAARLITDDTIYIDGGYHIVGVTCLLGESEPEPTRLHPNLAEVYRQKVAALHKAPADEASRDEAFELIRSLIDKVVVTPMEGDMHIDLHGELAGILALCREGRRGGWPDAEMVAQITLVAGAYNHLYRTFVTWTQPYRLGFLGAEQTCRT